MSLLTDLEKMDTDLKQVRTDTNTALSEKGSAGVQTLSELPEAIRNIPSSGGDGKKLLFSQTVSAFRRYTPVAIDNASGIITLDTTEGIPAEFGGQYRPTAQINPRFDKIVKANEIPAVIAASINIKSVGNNQIRVKSNNNELASFPETCKSESFFVYQGNTPHGIEFTQIPENHIIEIDVETPSVQDRGFSLNLISSENKDYGSSVSDIIYRDSKLKGIRYSLVALSSLIEDAASIPFYKMPAKMKIVVKPAGDIIYVSAEISVTSTKDNKTQDYKVYSTVEESILCNKGISKILVAEGGYAHFSNGTSVKIYDLGVAK